MNLVDLGSTVVSQSAKTLKSVMTLGMSEIYDDNVQRLKELEAKKKQLDKTRSNSTKYDRNDNNKTTKRKLAKIRHEMDMILREQEVCKQEMNSNLCKTTGALAVATGILCYPAVTLAMLSAVALSSFATRKLAENANEKRKKKNRLTFREAVAATPVKLTAMDVYLWQKAEELEKQRS